MNTPRKISAEEIDNLRCKHLYNPGTWPYIKRCENPVASGHIVCKDHLEWEGDYVDD